MSAFVRPRLALIAAVLSNGAIGRDNALLWSHPEDLKHFRALTMGEPVVMGRRTWDSLPPRYRPLPGRANVVVTRAPQTFAAVPGAQAAGSLDEALAMAAAPQGAATAPARVWVIGGGQLYVQALPQADELHLTEVALALPGDVHFPPWPREAFDEVSRDARQAEDGTRFDFVHYRRKA